MSGTIYIIKNTQNDKVYIGQTLNIKERWTQHKTAARNLQNRNNAHSILYPAMRKYGIDNFYLEILEDDVPNEKLNEREAYWIKYYNSVRPGGYNISSGGNIGEQYKHSIYQLDKDTLEIINEFDSLVSASRDTGIYLTGIQRVLSKVLITAGGYRWCYQEKYDEYKKNPPMSSINAKKNNTTLLRKVNQIDPATEEVIKEWNSVREAAETLNINNKSIYKVLCGANKTYKGFIWRYSNS